jgi:hypothetical protein
VFHRAEIEYFEDAPPALKCVLHAILQATGHGDEVSLKGDVRVWYSRVACSEGVLWLPVSWNVITPTDSLTSFWPPLLLKVLKVVMECKLSHTSTNDNSTSLCGLVTLLIGSLSTTKIQPILLKYYARVVNSFPFRIITAPDPPHQSFTELTSNPFVAVAHALMEVNQEPVNWLLTTNLGIFFSFSFFHLSVCRHDRMLTLFGAHCAPSAVL